MTEEELRKTRKERDDMRKEKDEIIAELQFKIDHMESAYESVLHVSIHTAVHVHITIGGVLNTK